MIFDLAWQDLDDNGSLVKVRFKDAKTPPDNNGCQEDAKTRVSNLKKNKSQTESVV